MKNFFIFIARCSPSADVNQKENTETPPAISTPIPTAISGGSGMPPSAVDKCEGWLFVLYLND